MTIEDDLRVQHERAVDVGVEKLMEMVEKDGDYLPLIQHLAESIEHVQSGATALLAMCYEKGLFTVDEYGKRHTQAIQILDQMNAAARDGIIKGMEKRLGGTNESQP